MRTSEAERTAYAKALRWDRKLSGFEKLKMRERLEKNGKGEERQKVRSERWAGTGSLQVTAKRF